MAYKRKVEIFEEAYTKKGEKSILSYDGRDGKKRYIAGSSDPDVEPGGGGGSGIESIEQTVTSEESGGVNIITVTTSDGATTDFQVRNGIQGATGPKGDQGNSGYSGAAGELEVVNNLTEGGEGSALSAEQGKVLNEIKAGVTNGEAVVKTISLNDSRQMYCYQVSTLTTRYYAVLLAPIKKGDTIQVQGVPSSYNFAITSRSTFADALSANTTTSVEDTGWQSSSYEMTFADATSKYLVIAFKCTNNAQITTANQTQIKDATSVVFTAVNEVYLNSQGVEINPVTQASAVKIGNTNVDALLSKSYISINTMGRLSGSTRRAYFFYQIPKGLIDISCDVTLPAGIRFVTKTAPTLAGAYNEFFVNSVDGTCFDSGWITRGKYHATIQNDKSECLGLIFSKTNNGAITLPEVMDIAKQFVVKVTDCVSTSLNERRALMTAHRGTFYFGIPENSLTSFNLARELGYDYIECDVRVTSDGKYIIMHDASIKRTCVNADNTPITTTINVASNTFDTLRTNYRLKSNNPDYRLPIPSLEEYLYAVKDSGSKAMVELEPLTNAQLDEVYAMCVEILGNGNFAFNSGYYAELDYIRTIDEDVVLLYETDPIIDTTNTIDGSTRNHPKNVWYANYTGTYGTVNASVVRQYHAKGMMVGVWTVPCEDYTNVLNMGVDLIATNDIAPSLVSANAVLQIFDRKHRYGGIITDGTISDDGITLANGQGVIVDSFSFEKGMMLFEVVGSGNFIITTNTKKLVSSGTGNTYSAVSKAVSSQSLVKTTIKALYCCDEFAEGLSGQVTPTITCSSANGAFIQSIKIYSVKI